MGVNSDLNEHTVQYITSHAYRQHHINLNSVGKPFLAVERETPDTIGKCQGCHIMACSPL